jgi:hypothetical protein
MSGGNVHRASCRTTLLVLRSGMRSAQVGVPVETTAGVAYYRPHHPAVKTLTANFSGIYGAPRPDKPRRFVNCRGCITAPGSQRQSRQLASPSFTVEKVRNCRNSTLRSQRQSRSGCAQALDLEPADERNATRAVTPPPSDRKVCPTVPCPRHVAGVAEVAVQSAQVIIFQAFDALSTSATRGAQRGRSGPKALFRPQEPGPCAPFPRRCRGVTVVPGSPRATLRERQTTR